MKRLTVKDLSVEEKLRLLCSNGFWYTMDFDGKLPSVSVSDGPVGVRAERKNEKGETITLPSVSYPSAQLLANTWNKACAKLMGECLADDCYEKKRRYTPRPWCKHKKVCAKRKKFRIFFRGPSSCGGNSRKLYKRRSVARHRRVLKAFLLQ